MLWHPHELSNNLVPRLLFQKDPEIFRDFPHCPITSDVVPKCFLNMISGYYSKQLAQKRKKIKHGDMRN